MIRFFELQAIKDMIFIIVYKIPYRVRARAKVPCIQYLYQKTKTFGTGRKWPLLILSSVLLYALKFKFSDQKSWYPVFDRSVLFAIVEPVWSSIFYGRLLVTVT